MGLGATKETKSNFSIDFSFFPARGGLIAPTYSYLSWPIAHPALPSRQPSSCSTTMPPPPRMRSWWIDSAARPQTAARAAAIARARTGAEAAAAIARRWARPHLEAAIPLYLRQHPPPPPPEEELRAKVTNMSEGEVITRSWGATRGREAGDEAGLVAGSTRHPALPGVS